MVDNVDERYALTSDLLATRSECLSLRLRHTLNIWPVTPTAGRGWRLSGRWSGKLKGTSGVQVPPSLTINRVFCGALARSCTPLARWARPDGESPHIKRQKRPRTEKQGRGVSSCKRGRRTTMEWKRTRLCKERRGSHLLLRVEPPWIRSAPYRGKWELGKERKVAREMQEVKKMARVQAKDRRLASRLLGREKCKKRVR